MNTCSFASIAIAPLLLVLLEHEGGHGRLSLLLLGSTRYGCLVVASHVLTQ